MKRENFVKMVHQKWKTLVPIESLHFSTIFIFSVASVNFSRGLVFLGGLCAWGASVGRGDDIAWVLLHTVSVAISQIAPVSWPSSSHTWHCILAMFSSHASTSMKTIGASSPCRNTSWWSPFMFAGNVGVSGREEQKRESGRGLRRELGLVATGFLSG